MVKTIHTVIRFAGATLKDIVNMVRTANSLTPVGTMEGRDVIPDTLVLRMDTDRDQGTIGGATIERNCKVLGQKMKAKNGKIIGVDTIREGMFALIVNMVADSGAMKKKQE